MSLTQFDESAGRSLRGRFEIGLPGGLRRQRLVDRESPPWPWIALKRPVAYYFSAEGGSYREILALGNPLAWWPAAERPGLQGRVSVPKPGGGCPTGQKAHVPIRLAGQVFGSQIVASTTFLSSSLLHGRFQSVSTNLLCSLRSLFQSLFASFIVAAPVSIAP